MESLPQSLLVGQGLLYLTFCFGGVVARLTDVGLDAVQSGALLVNYLVQVLVHFLDLRQGLGDSGDLAAPHLQVVGARDNLKFIFLLQLDGLFVEAESVLLLFRV